MCCVVMWKTVARSDDTGCWRWSIQMFCLFVNYSQTYFIWHIYDRYSPFWSGSVTIDPAIYFAFRFDMFFIFEANDDVIRTKMEIQFSTRYDKLREKRNAFFGMENPMRLTSYAWCDKLNSIFRFNSINVSIHTHFMRARARTFFVLPLIWWMWMWYALDDVDLNDAFNLLLKIKIVKMKIDSFDKKPTLATSHQ